MLSFSEELHCVSTPRRIAFHQLIFVVFLLIAGARAQELSPGPKDEEGFRHAGQLLQAYAKADGLEDPQFLNLFDQNPNLTRRAFLPMRELVQAEKDPKQAELASALFRRMAILIDEHFADVIPLYILDVLDERRPGLAPFCERYTRFLISESQRPLKLSAEQLRSYDPYYDTYDIVDTVADQPSGQWIVMKPIYIKFQRHSTAFLLENYKLAWNEQESYPAALSGMKERLREVNLDGNYEEVLDSPEVEGNFSFINLCETIELGLLDHAMARMAKATDDPRAFDCRWTIAYLAASRVAFQQARLPVLAETLALARREMAQDPEVSGRNAVLEFIIRTTEYKKRRLEGWDPTDDQVAAEFENAWSALKNYEPMEAFSVDEAWLEGRHATRFWMDELLRLNSGNEQHLRRIGADWQKWWDITLVKQGLVQEPDELLYKSQYLDSFYVLGPNYFDQLTYRWVHSSEITLDPKELEWAQSSIKRLPETINWVIEGETGPGFGPYDVSATGLLPELLARCKLVGARRVDLAASARAALLEESIQLAKRSTQTSSFADHMVAVGREFADLEQSELAIACWTETLAQTDQVPLAKPRFEALYLLALEYFNSKDFEKAVHYADLATEQLEVVSPLVGTRSREAQRWSRDLSDLTSLKARSYIAANSPEKALAALNLGSQMQAAALVVEGDREAKADSVKLMQQQQEVAAVTEQVSKLESQPQSPIRDELLAQSRQLLADSKAQYLVKSRELRQKHGELYSQALKFDPLDLPNLQSQLPADVAVLQYFPTEDTLYTFLVSKESFRLRSVAVPRKELDKQIVTFLRGLRRNVPADAQVAAQSRELYDTLIAPSSEDLQGKSSVVLIPTGRLHGLPFACLADPQGRPLVEKWRLVELAKSTDLQRLAKGADLPIESIVAFANATGDLPAAQSEGEKVASIFPKSKLFETKEATKSNFFSYGGGAQVLHIATHGEWNLDDSLKNYLAMAGSEKIAQEEIFQLALDDTSLVILSACNTAMGEGAEGGYVASLAEAFWLAGSHSVVASLWSVDDSSTAMLMETFYQRLKAGDDKAEALRAAQLKVRSEKKFEHPYYWAGFVLFGERR